ncbi:MAG: hypothetical protein WKF31_09630 [Thermoleophilaceae bacterium]
MCAGAVLVAGARIGEGAVVGDQAHVRERASVGAGSVIGRGSAIDNDVEVGGGVRIQTGCYLTAFTLVEDDVFVAPGCDHHQRPDDGAPRSGDVPARRRRFAARAEWAAVPPCCRASRWARRRSWARVRWSPSDVPAAGGGRRRARARAPPDRRRGADRAVALKLPRPDRSPAPAVGHARAADRGDRRGGRARPPPRCSPSSSPASGAAARRRCPSQTRTTSSTPPGRRWPRPRSWRSPATRTSRREEKALFNLLASFVASFGAVRAITYLLRDRDAWGPFRNVTVGRRHIHHFVPGIAMAFVAGAVAVTTHDERLTPKLAIPMGAGMGLTLDESALLLELEDVYWTREGLVSVQITLATAAMLAALALGLRLLRRGEEIVLGDDEPPT